MEQILKKDIILVPFPFSDLTGQKKRPALVISSNIFNKNSGQLIVLAITSNIDKGEYSAIIKPEDWKNGRYSESCIKISTILTIDRGLVLKKIGKLSDERFGEAMLKLRAIIGE